MSYIDLYSTLIHDLLRGQSPNTYCYYWNSLHQLVRIFLSTSKVLLCYDEHTYNIKPHDAVLETLVTISLTKEDTVDKI